MKALMTTDYGLCVFHANNDVSDHQIVDMLFDGNVTATLTVNAFNGGGRAIHLFGTKGELVAEANDTEIRVYNSDIRKWSSVPVKETEESILGGHGGGDQGIIADLYDYLCGTYNGCSVADISVSQIISSALLQKEQDTRTPSSTLTNTLPNSVLKTT